MEKVFVDTGFWYALNDRLDPAHARALASFKENTLPLVTSKAVLWETLTLIRYRLGHHLAVQFGEEIMTDARVGFLEIGQQDEREAWRVFRRHHDQRLSFTDCLSFTLMRRSGIRKALAFDGDFSRMGFTLPEDEG